jgi:hypothetical protein
MPKQQVKGGKKNRKLGRQTRKHAHQMYNVKHGYTAGSSPKAGKKRLIVVKVASVPLTKEEQKAADYREWLNKPYIPDTAFPPYKPKHPKTIRLVVTHKLGGPEVGTFCITNGKKHARCHHETRMAYANGAYDLPIMA